MGCNCGGGKTPAGGAGNPGGRGAGGQRWRHYRPDGSYRDYASESRAEEVRQVVGGTVRPVG